MKRIKEILKNISRMKGTVLLCFLALVGLLFGLVGNSDSTKSFDAANNSENIEEKEEHEHTEDEIYNLEEEVPSDLIDVNYEEEPVQEIEKKNAGAFHDWYSNYGGDTTAITFAFDLVYDADYSSYCLRFTQNEYLFAMWALGSEYTQYIVNENGDYFFGWDYLDALVEYDSFLYYFTDSYFHQMPSSYTYPDKISFDIGFYYYEGDDLTFNGTCSYTNPENVFNWYIDDGFCFSTSDEFDGEVWFNFDGYIWFEQAGTSHNFISIDQTTCTSSNTTYYFNFVGIYISYYSDGSFFKALAPQSPGSEYIFFMPSTFAGNVASNIDNFDLDDTSANIYVAKALGITNDWSLGDGVYLKVDDYLAGPGSVTLIGNATVEITSNGKIDNLSIDNWGLYYDFDAYERDIQLAKVIQDGEIVTLYYKDPFEWERNVDSLTVIECQTPWMDDDYENQYFCRYSTNFCFDNLYLYNSDNLNTIYGGNTNDIYYYYLSIYTSDSEYQYIDINRESNNNYPEFEYKQTKAIPSGAPKTFETLASYGLFKYNYYEYEYMKFINHNGIYYVPSTSVEVAVDSTGNFSGNGTVEFFDFSMYDNKGNEMAEWSFQVQVGNRTINYSISNNSAVYDGESHSPKITVTNETRGITIKYGTSANSLTTTVPKYTDFIETTIYFSISISYNSTGIFYETKTGSFTFKIEKADLSDLKVNMPSYKYGGELPTPSTDGNLGNATVIYYYSKSESTAGGISWTSVGNSTALDANTYYMYAVIEESQNYKAATTALVPFDVLQADGILILSASDANLVYGTATNSFTIVETHGGTLSVAESTATAAVPALSSRTVNITGLGSIASGTVIRITVTCAATTNYEPATATYTLTVTPATLTVTSTGVNTTYNGAGHSGSLSVTAVNNQTPTIYYATEALTSSNYNTAGSTTNPSFIDSCNKTVYYYVVAPNHNAATGSFTVNITKANLVITVECTDQTSEYNGQVEYTGNHYIASYNGLVGKDTSADIDTIVSFTGTVIYKFNGTDLSQSVGSYNIKATGLSATATNYNVSATYGTSGILQITARSLETATVTLPNIELVYSGSAHEPTPTVTIVLVSGNAATTLTVDKDYTVSYSNNTNASKEAVVTITGKGNYKDSVNKKFTINQAEVTSLMPTLSAKTLNVLTLTNNVYGYTTLKDIDLSADKNEYGKWTFAEGTDLTAAIYQTKEVYKYTYNLVFDATDNYKDSTGTLTVNLNKNEVLFGELEKVTKTYDRDAIDAPSNPVLYYNNSFHNKLSYNYFLNSSLLDYTPTDANTYNYKVVLAENEYFKAAESQVGLIVINPKNLADLDVTFVAVSEQTYTGSEIKPTTTLTYKSVALKNTEISFGYTNNINATRLSGSKAQINVTSSSSNYTGTKVIEFVINPKALTEDNVTIDEIAEQIYTGSEIKPTPKVTDNARNAALNATVGTVIGDFKFTYENNTNVTKEAIVNIISENGNYEGSIPKKFIILKATLDVITPYGLSSTVDSLLSSIDMSEFNVGGTWSFVEEPTTIVATSVGDGSVIKEVKFTPTDSDNYETLTRETVIIIRLNNSSVKFDDKILTDDGILTKVYDTYTFNIDNKYINKLDEKGNKYESEFDSDPIQFRWYDEAGNEILAPKNVGEYKVQVTVPANRKYKSATSEMTSVTITKANISVASIEFIDFDAEPNKYQYTTKQICPKFVLSYNDDTDLKDSINTTYKNNIELTSVDNVPTITVTATGNYEGTTSFTFDIVKRDIATVDLADIVDQYFNGQPVEVQLTLTNYGTVLVLNEDFNVIYTDNDKVGTATITITGIGKYTGERIEGFEIIKKLIDSSKLPELSNLTAYVGTKLKDIELPSNEFGSWVFVLVANKEENALDPTVGAANANGTNFDVEFRDLNNEYSPTQDHISIVVIKYNGTITNISDISKVYNTKSVNDPTYTYNGDSLERNVKYYQNGVELDVAPKAAGNYEVVITTSETEMYTAAEGRKTFTISRARIGKTGDATADAIIEEIAIQPYQNGAQVKPTVVINHIIGENETIQLSGTTDFDVIYSANNEQGPAAGTVYVFGLGNYYTTNSYETVTFDIGEGTTPPGIEDPEGNEIIVDIAFDNYDYQFVPTYVYTGEEITPTIIVKNITDTDSITDIDPNYYDVEFTNNINKGTATVTITFKDGYDGSYSETFKIDPYALTKENVHAEYDQNDEVVVVVKAFGNKVPNTEYTFVIDGENVIVTGKNNYADTVTVEIEGKEPNVITIKNAIYKFYTINKRGKLKEQTNHTYSESTTVYLRNVADETTIDVFLQQFVNTRRLFVRDMNGSLIDSLDYQDICIGTGCTLELYDINDKLLDKVTVVVVNDFNGDGRISRPDKSTLDGLVSGTVTNELMVMAGDYRVDGGCDAEEYEILLQSFDRGSTFDPNEKYRINN